MPRKKYERRVKRTRYESLHSEKDDDDDDEDEEEEIIMKPKRKQRDHQTKAEVCIK